MKIPNGSQKYHNLILKKHDKLNKQTILQRTKVWTCKELLSSNHIEKKWDVLVDLLLKTYFFFLYFFAFENFQFRFLEVL